MFFKVHVVSLHQTIKYLSLLKDATVGVRVEVRWWRSVSPVTATRGREKAFPFLFRTHKYSCWSRDTRERDQTFWAHPRSIFCYGFKFQPSSSSWLDDPAGDPGAARKWKVSGRRAEVIFMSYRNLVSVGPEQSNETKSTFRNERR